MEAKVESPDKDVSWLLENGFEKREGSDMYDRQVSPGIRFSVQRHDTGKDRIELWTCDACVEKMMAFLPTSGLDAESAVNRQAYNVCLTFIALSDTVWDFLDKASKRLKAVAEDVERSRKEIGDYQANIKALSPLLGKDVFLIREGEPAFVGSRKTLEEACGRLYMELKEEEVRPFVTKTEVHDGFVRLKAEGSNRLSGRTRDLVDKLFRRTSTYSDDWWARDSPDINYWDVTPNTPTVLLRSSDEPSHCLDPRPELMLLADYSIESGFTVWVAASREDEPLLGIRETGLTLGKAVERLKKRFEETVQ